MMVWKMFFFKRVFSGSMSTFLGVFWSLEIYLLFSFASSSLSSLGGVLSSTRIPLRWTVGLDGLNKNKAMSHDRRTCFIILFPGFSRFLEPYAYDSTKFWKMFAPVVWICGSIFQLAPVTKLGLDDTFCCGILLVRHRNWGWVSTLPLKLAALWDVIWFACFWLTVLYTLRKRPHVFYTFSCNTSTVSVSYRFW